MLADSINNPALIEAMARAIMKSEIGLEYAGESMIKEAEWHLTIARWVSNATAALHAYQAYADTLRTDPLAEPAGKG